MEGKLPWFHVQVYSHTPVFVIPLWSQWKERLENEQQHSGTLESAHNTWAGGIGWVSLSCPLEVIKNHWEEFLKRRKKDEKLSADQPSSVSSRSCNSLSLLSWSWDTSRTCWRGGGSPGISWGWVSAHHLSPVLVYIVLFNIAASFCFLLNKSLPSGSSSGTEPGTGEAVKSWYSKQPDVGRACPCTPGSVWGWWEGVLCGNVVVRKGGCHIFSHFVCFWALHHVLMLPCLE